MPKRVNVLPNQRIDVVDFKASTETFANESDKLRWESFIQDNLPRVSDGFRVEVSGLTLTVFNGLAFDRDGEIVVNETDDSAQRSVTLASTNATYYVEVEFVTSEGDVDSRAFWDP